MTSQLMNHEEAISRLAAERYLLGEMKEDERAAFEEHYLSCAACLEAVTFGHDFMEQAQPLARELRVHEEAAKAPAPERDSGSFFGRLLAGLRSPVPALAFALLLCLAGLSAYQAIIIRSQQKTLAQAQAPSQEFRYVITGQSRGGEKVIAVNRNSRLSLRVEFMPEQGLTSYRAEILSESDALKYSLPLTVKMDDDSANFSLPAGALEPGKYSVMVRGQLPDGTLKNLASGSFELQLVD